MTGLYKCPFCDGDLCQGGETPANEIYDGYSDEDDATVSIYTCMRCGRDIEVSEPPLEKRKNEYAEYWSKHKD